MSYKTELINSSNAARLVRDADGTGLVWLNPSESAFVDAADATGSFSRWERIEFIPEGALLHERKGWSPPPKPEGWWVVTLLNKDGAAMEARSWPGVPSVTLTKGIPVTVYVRPDSPISRFADLVIRMAEEWIPIPRFPGYFERQTVLKDVWIERSEQELAQLAAQLEDIERAAKEKADAQA